MGDAHPLVNDDFWAPIEPLLPPEPPKPKGGRPRIPDRSCLVSRVRRRLRWAVPGRPPGVVRWSAPAACRQKGPATGRNSVDRGKAGTKYLLITDQAGLSLAVDSTGTNRPASMRSPLPGVLAPTPDRLHRCRGERPIGAALLGHWTDFRPATSVSTVADPLRTARRHPWCLPLLACALIFARALERVW